MAGCEARSLFDTASVLCYALHSSDPRSSGSTRQFSGKNARSGVSHRCLLIRRGHSILGEPHESDSISPAELPRTRSNAFYSNEIARVREEEARRSLITAALEHRLSRDEVSAILQRMRRGGLGVQEAVQEILRMRPIIERQFLFVGQLPREVRADASDLCLQRDIRKAVAELLGASNVLSVSCKNRRYSVLISEEGASQPVVSSNFTPDKLDTYIGSLISSEL